MSSSDRLVEPANYRRSTNIRAGLCALTLYFFWSFLLIAQKPGLQYDEAMHVAGAVHMLRGHGEFRLPHDPHTWVSLGQRSFPLMTLRCTGAVKEYFCLPLFALTGPRMSLVRLASVLLGGLGIWGLYVLCRDRFSVPIATAAACLLAINPTYINQTAFDNTAVGAWMAAFGLLCLALNRYVREPGPGGAVLVGLAVGFAVWSRANFLWLLGAAILAAALVWRRRLLPPLSHTVRMATGAVVGAMPFLIYQIVSKGGTWEALRMYPAKGAWIERIYGRCLLLSETLLSDREHRAMWAAAEMPSWQSWLMAGVLIASLCICLVPRLHAGAVRREWARAVALAFLFLAAIQIVSSLDVSEHHLVVLLPLAAVAFALAGAALWRYNRVVKAVLVAFACVYAGLTLSWNQRACAGLAETGGVGLWSNASIPLTQHIEQSYSGRLIEVLDWGFQSNLYVLSSGRVSLLEIYAQADANHVRPGRTWQQELTGGGIYLLPGPGLRSFPAAAEAFRDALSRSESVFRRFTVKQRNGEEYATLVEIQPWMCPGTRISTGDPTCAARLEGFHQIEEGGWRWSSKTFAATLRMPRQQPAGGLRLTVSVHVPDAANRALGPITMTAHLGDAPLGRQTFRKAGDHTFTAKLDTAKLDAQANTFRFVLDKCIEPSATDGRQLGVIVSVFSIEAQ